MKEKNVAILTISREGREIALLLRDELPGVTLYSTVEAEGFRTMASLREGCRELIGEYSALIFCSADMPRGDRDHVVTRRVDAEDGGIDVLIL